MLGAKFKLHVNETILSLQYCNLKVKAMSLPKNRWAGCILRLQVISTKNMTEG